MEEVSVRKNSGFIGAIGRLISGKKKVTEEEIHELMDAGAEEGLINEEESEMIRAIFTLRDTVVREVMVPRTDMASIPADASLQDAITTIITCGHSRIPVYEGTIDNITGILYAKDLLKFWNTETDGLALESIVRQPFYVPETKKLEELLQDFRGRRVHIAIVVDEYGGTSGLITIEDLLEEIVGEIRDEYDLEEDLVQLQEDGTVIVDARLSIEEFEEYFETEVEREKFDTVGGLVIFLLGRIPQSGDTVLCNDVLLTVLSADERRIGRLQAERRALEPLVGGA